MKKQTAAQGEAMELIDRLQGTLIADLNSVILWAGDFDNRKKKRPTELGGLNFTSALLALVGCETLGFFATGAVQHQKSLPRTQPDVGTYIMTFVTDYFPKESPFRKLEKVLADFLRHDLVHGFGNANPNLPFDLGLFVSKETSKHCKADHSAQGKRQLNMNAIALARDTISAFFKLKKRVKSGKHPRLVGNIVSAKNLSLPLSKGAVRQFEVFHAQLVRQTRAKRSAADQRGT